jgi:hypothetical protein
MARETLVCYWPPTVANTLRTIVHRISVGKGDVVKHTFVGELLSPGYGLHTHTHTLSLSLSLSLTLTNPITKTLFHAAIGKRRFNPISLCAAKIYRLPLNTSTIFRHFSLSRETTKVNQSSSYSYRNKCS